MPAKSTHLINDKAESLIRSHRGRITKGRVQVLAVLLDTHRALTHLEIEQLVDPEIDRVTLYRVLDWLVERDLAHRISDEDRVWRFSLTRRNKAFPHPHFHCTECGQVICLSDVHVPPLHIPNKYEVKSIELMVNGVCEECRFQN